MIDSAILRSDPNRIRESQRRRGEDVAIVDRLIEAGRHHGATAIHPGWGFLSENPEFARAAEAEGWIFIGPTAEHARDLGDKVTARTLASKAGVPCTPAWSPEPDLSAEEESTAWNRKAQEIGYPVLVKAVSGGGGKGMRIVRDADELTEALPAARREALSSFNDDRVFLEKFVEPARHIEVQVLGDGKGEVAIIGDRECSLQRRHQKLVEEAPAANIRGEIREAMQEAARSLARSVDYRGAGTVEFLYDAAKDSFFFLEMNTRVQVEHPVTEVQTGIDIVKEQLWIAFTGDTALKQSDIDPRGHSIECRVNAENPALDFQPSPGTISVCHQPSGFRTRVDGSVFQGCKITPYYDSLIAKVICKGRNRTEAIQRTLRSLDEFVLEGITTTIDLHKKILKHKKFINSDFDTNWLGKEKFY